MEGLLRSGEVLESVIHGVTWLVTRGCFMIDTGARLFVEAADNRSRYPLLGIICINVVVKAILSSLV